ncbi:MAG TPA: hypothetical protein VMZ53_10740 [Kofleriaceae bacterium]|nr:hypothetical protein [Kofleriaceae bacterium]
MRFALAILSTAFLFAACGGDEEESYDTYKACFDDHHNVESLPVDQAIVVCCIEHEIGGAAKNTLCGGDSAACTTYVTAQLGQSATTAEISAGCTTYQSQH